VQNVLISSNLTKTSHTLLVIFDTVCAEDFVEIKAMGIWGDMCCYCFSISLLTDLNN